MILYHFPSSPVARRVRLALALKGVTVEPRHARAVPEHRAEVHRLNPCTPGWTLPAALTAWADQHRKRPDVATLS